MVGLGRLAAAGVDFGAVAQGDEASRSVVEGATRRKGLARSGLDAGPTAAWLDLVGGATISRILVW